MNRAAEAAVPEAKSRLIAAVKSMSGEEGLKIMRGGDTSVTDIVATKTRPPLGEKFLPIVTGATEEVARADKSNAVAGKAVGLDPVKKEVANVEQCATGETLDALYLAIDDEERRIRRDPVAAGSETLKKVLGR